MLHVFSKNRSDRRRNSSVLIVILLVLALLTIMVVAFNALAFKDLSATESYGQSVRAQEMALSGLDRIVSQIQTEITDPLNNSAIDGNGSSTMYMYVPKSANAVPQRMVTNTLFPIVTVSGQNVYTNTLGPVTDLASDSSSTNASLNNRSISVARWCKPQFLPTAVTSSFVAPKWVIVTRGGPKAFPVVGTDPSTAGLSVSSLTNMDQAVGRYAYVVYDTSGLLDINVAGYPSSAASNAAPKGVLPWADLTQLDSSTITTQDVDNLVSWRNATNYPTYASYVTNWETNGFRQVAPGDTTFLSRQDLIDYLQNYNQDLTNALPYLTTFSREVNGPTWGPSTNAGANFNYQTISTSVGSTNRLIYDVRAANGGWTRQNGTTAVAGEPLVKYRFPLDKLALLESVGTTYTSGQWAANVNNIQTQIQQYFGLVLANDSNGLYRHWIYTNPAGGTTPVGQILTLDAVAALNREPDFFELLKAGILSGSLGKGDANCDWYSGLTDYDSYPDYQIIRIGANIIDQWTSDSYPTAIAFNTLISASLGESESCDFYGIKDVPYINKVLIRANGSTPNVTVSGGVTVPGPPYNVYLYFEVWNPHQQTGSASTYPTSFRIAPLAGANLASGTNARDYYQMGIGNHSTEVDTILGWTPYIVPGHPPGAGVWPTGYSPNWGHHGGYNAFNLALTANAGIVPLTVTPSSYRTPTIVPGASGSAYVIANNNPPAVPTVGAMYLGQIPDPSAVTGWPGWTSFSQNFIYYATDLILQIQYQDAGGTWRTYGSFSGMPDNDIVHFQNADGCLGDSFIYIAPTTSAASLDSAAFLKSDPRTCRFGVGEMIRTGSTYTTGSAGAPLTPSANSILSAQYVETYAANSQGGPFFGASGVPVLSQTLPYRMDMWAVNSTSVVPKGQTVPTTVTYFAGIAPSAGTKAPYYTDNDGVVRAGDAALAYPNASPYFTGATSAQPIVLNHPFTSVADIGYAFRDMPWKTLDLSSPNSADAGLLDLFTLSDAPIVAGRFNPNTAPIPVLEALLSGTQANITTTVAGSISTLSPTSAATIAEQVNSAAISSPFLNRSAMVGFLATNSVVSGMVPSGIKVEREAAIRALAESANTRTWNFTIDIIAQSGNYPQTATTLDNFNVTGERRYWLHIAIDRYTGQVVDRQLEPVNE